MKNEDLSKARYYMFIAIAIITLFVILNAILLVGCTISLNNVSTSGKAEDVIDEQQEASPDVHPDIDIPLTPSISAL